MPSSRNDARLAYLNANRGINESTIKDLASDGAINYQLPSKSIFKSTAEDLSGSTALHIATRHEDLDSVSRLLKNGAVVTVKDARGMTALHRAVECERSSVNSPVHKLRGPVKDSIVSVLLNAHLDNNVTENPRSRNGISHLHAACIVDNVEVVEFLLKNGASPDESVDANSPILPGYTPLHFAVRYCSAEVAEVLLDHGARPHATDKFGSTPLQMLIKRNMDIADWMNLGKRARCGYLAKEYKSNEATIKAILKASSQDIFDDTGLSRLHAACTLSDTSILEKLLEESALDATRHATDFEQTAKKNWPRRWPGYTALHFAAHFNPTAVKLLMKRGGDMLARAANKFTPLDLCLQRYRAEIVHDLIASHSEWREIRFSDERMKLVDFVLSMQSEDEFRGFVEDRYVNAFVPHDSPILPGYSPLHFATVAPARTRSVDELLKDTLYATKIDESDVFNCDEGEDDLYMKRIDILLARDPDFTIYDRHHKSTALHLAFTLQRSDAAKAMAKKYSATDSCDKLNLLDADELSHFQIACATGERKLAEVLLRLNRSRCTDGCMLPDDYEFAGVLLAAASTPLHIAVSMGHVELVRFLLSEDFDIYEQDVDGMTPIHRAFAVKSTETCEALLKWKIESLEDREEDDGLTHLHVACAVGNAKAVAALLRSGTDVNARIGADFEEDWSVCGLTALQIAIRERSRDVARMLIRSGADAFVQPLEYVDELYQRYPDLFFEAMGRHASLTPLHVACFAIDVERVKALLDAGADPNAKVCERHPVWPNYTPLHMLATECRRRKSMVSPANEVARMMIEGGADVRLSVGDGVTPLHEAFHVDERDLVDRGFFVSKGCKDEDTKVPERVQELLKMPHASFMMQVVHAWNGGDCSENLDVKDDDPLTLHRQPVAQSTDGIRGKIGFTRGLHVWEIHWSASKRGTHAVVGVATAEAPMRGSGYFQLLGSNEWSCGWDLGRKKLVNNEGVDLDRDVYPRYLQPPVSKTDRYGQEKYMPREKPIEDFMVPDVITVVLDMDEGTLAYMVDGKYLGIAFEGLKGKTIFPAVSVVWGHAEITMKYIGSLETANPPSTLATLLSGHRDFSVNPTDPKGISTFHIACRCNDVALVEKFLRHGVDVDLPIDHFSEVCAGYAPLHLAARHKFVETVDLLIEYGADIHVRDREGNTPLHCAADYSGKRFGEKLREDVLASLFRAGADIKATNKFGQTPVEILMETKGITDKTAEMFLQNQSRVHTFNGFNAGYIATAISRASTVEDVLKHPVYAAVIDHPGVNGVDEMGRTPIHNIVALRRREEKSTLTVKIYVEAIRELMKLEFDVDQYDHEGRTPLHYAVKFQNAAATRALLDLGADFNIVDIDGETAYSLGWKLRKEATPEIFEIFAKHSNKLKLAGLEVSEVNDEVYQNRVDGSEALDCKEELELMEKVDFGGFTLREFLSDENALTLYENMESEEARKRFDEMFEIGCEKKLVYDYPEFSGILKMQYRKVRAQVTVPSAAEDSSFFSSVYSYLSWS